MESLSGWSIARQGFSFDYLVPRRASENGCTGTCYGQVAKLVSHDDATQEHSEWCVCPDRVSVLAQSGRMLDFQKSSDESAKLQPPFSLYVVENSTHKTPGFELPIFYGEYYTNTDGPLVWALQQLTRHFHGIMHSLCYHWLSLLEVAESHMRLLVRQSSFSSYK